MLELTGDETLLIWAMAEQVSVRGRDVDVLAALRAKLRPIVEAAALEAHAAIQAQQATAQAEATPAEA